MHTTRQPIMYCQTQICQHTSKRKPERDSTHGTIQEEPQLPLLLHQMWALFFWDQKKSQRAHSTNQSRYWAMHSRTFWAWKWSAQSRRCDAPPSVSFEDLPPAPVSSVLVFCIMWMCRYIYGLYTCVFICICIYICVCILMCTCVFVCIYIYIYIQITMYICMYICIYICMYMYIYIYIYTCI